MPDTIQSNSINSHYTQNRNKMKLFKAYLFASVSIMWILEREDMMVFGKNLINPSILCSWPMEIIMLNLWGLNVADSLLLVLELENTWSNFIYIETNNLMNTPNILFQLILIILMYNVLYSTYMTKHIKMEKSHCCSDNLDWFVTFEWTTFFHYQFMKILPSDDDRCPL